MTSVQNKITVETSMKQKTPRGLVELYGNIEGGHYEWLVQAAGLNTALTLPINESNKGNEESHYLWPFQSQWKKLRTIKPAAKFLNSVISIILNMLHLIFSTPSV